MKSAKIDWRAWPLGACDVCLEQWRDRGLPGRRYELDGGAFLLAGYCSHREAGFWTIIRPPEFAATEWTIRTPIAIEEWQAYVRLLPGNIAATRAAFRGGSRGDPASA